MHTFCCFSRDRSMCWCLSVVRFAASPNFFPLQCAVNREAVNMYVDRIFHACDNMPVARCWGLALHAKYESIYLYLSIYLQHHVIHYFITLSCTWRLIKIRGNKSQRRNLTACYRTYSLRDVYIYDISNPSNGRNATRSASGGPKYTKLHATRTWGRAAARSPLRAFNLIC